MAAVHIVHWRKYRHSAWGVGRCPHCRQVEAWRVRDVVQVTSLYFIPISRQVIGQDCLCDFCGRAMPGQTASFVILRENWNPKQGLRSLFDKLGIEGDALPPVNSDKRLRSLLDAVQAVASPKSMSVLPGMYWGLGLGIPLGIALSLVAFSLGIAADKKDAGLAAVCGFGLGGFAGAALGASLYAWLAGGRIANKRLMAACEKYGIDRTRLFDLASIFNDDIVRRAARNCRDSPDGDPR